MASKSISTVDILNAAGMRWNLWAAALQGMGFWVSFTLSGCNLELPWKLVPPPSCKACAATLLDFRDEDMVAWYGSHTGGLAGASSRKDFGHIESVKILVILNPTGYMLTSSGQGIKLTPWGVYFAS